MRTRLDGLAWTPVAALLVNLVLLCSAPYATCASFDILPNGVISSSDSDIRVATARQYLKKLRVVPEPPRVGYYRPRWRARECLTTDKWVKLRDSSSQLDRNVWNAYAFNRLQRDSVCEDWKKPLQGPWRCPYSGRFLQSESDVQVDHVVALAEAWDSGADKWSPEEYDAYANDLSFRHTLRAVDGSTNGSKLNKDPAEWMPSDCQARTDYAVAWIMVKHKYRLSVDEAEKHALEVALAERC